MGIATEDVASLIASIENYYQTYRNQGYSHEFAIAYTALVAEEEIGYHGIVEAFEIWCKQFESKEY